MKEAVAVVLGAVVLGLLAVQLAPMGRASEEPRSSTPAIESPGQALARGDASGAMRVWNDAHRAAVAHGRWEDLLDVADSYRRLGEAAGRQSTFDRRAREIYLSALSRARQQRSLDGVLSVAEALAAMGDREGVEQCIRLAERLATGDPEARADVRAFAARVADLRVAH